MSQAEGKKNPDGNYIFRGIPHHLDAVLLQDTKPCTVPTSPQLKAVLLPEIRKLISGIPDKIKQYFPVEAQTDRVIMGDNAF